MPVTAPGIQVMSILKLIGIIPIQKGILVPKEGHYVDLLSCYSEARWRVTDVGINPVITVGILNTHLKILFQFCTIVQWDTNRETDFNGIEAPKHGRKQIVFQTATIIHHTTTYM